MNTDAFHSALKQLLFISLVFSCAMIVAIGAALTDLWVLSLIILELHTGNYLPLFATLVMFAGFCLFSWGCWWVTTETAGDWVEAAREFLDAFEQLSREGS